jgi:hypothetical protein
MVKKPVNIPLKECSGYAAPVYLPGKETEHPIDIFECPDICPIITSPYYNNIAFHVPQHRYQHACCEPTQMQALPCRYNICQIDISAYSLKKQKRCFSRILLLCRERQVLITMLTSTKSSANIFFEKILTIMTAKLYLYFPNAFSPVA